MKNKATLLIVDDNEVNLDMLISILHQYDVIPVTNGATAFEVLAEEKVDLILLDVMMPDINGFDVCKRLKLDDKIKNIPVIFLTAKNEIDDIKKGFDVGAVDYVAKPFSTIELLSRVNTHLQLKDYQENLQKQVDQEIEKNKLQEQIIFQNSKQAEIGELLMHIAHQWKQPLSELGSVNLLNTMCVSNESLNVNELKENFERTSLILDFMSKTVETFQDFYKPNTNNSFFDILSTIKKAFNILSATFDYENIILKINKDVNPRVYANQNEYAQVILSILNNSKDIFILRKIKNRVITITIEEENKKSIVTIEDNAGGIELENIDDIFLPYVSGKGSMGIGLYMSQNIMKKNNGTLEVENTGKGAKFTITL
ncbi:MAG: hybrid sensor histidine kinase/response regulator [Arcobacteraceae bacterium]